MKNEIDGMCTSSLRGLEQVLKSNYKGNWNENFDRLFADQASAVIRQLDTMFRSNPDFRIAEDLSNFGESSLLPGTEAIGREILETVRARFKEFRKLHKKA